MSRPAILGVLLALTDVRAAGSEGVGVQPLSTVAPPFCNIDRVAPGLLRDHFTRLYEEKRPFIMENASEGWPANKLWTRESLMRNSRIKVLLEEYISTGEQSIGDDWMDEFPKLFRHYSTPSFLPGEENLLRDLVLHAYAWRNHSLTISKSVWEKIRHMKVPWTFLIFSPWRSGSPMHVDPPHTAFWNVLISGHKRWAFLDANSSIAKSLLENDHTAADSSPGSRAEQFFQQTAPELIEAAADQSDAIGEINYWQCDTWPGDLIYGPTGMPHVVQTFAESFSVSEQVISRPRALLTLVRQHLVDAEKACFAQSTLECSSHFVKTKRRFDIEFLDELEDGLHDNTSIGKCGKIGVSTLTAFFVCIGVDYYPESISTRLSRWPVERHFDGAEAEAQKECDRVLGPQGACSASLDAILAGGPQQPAAHRTPSETKMPSSEL